MARCGPQRACCLLALLLLAVAVQAQTEAPVGIGVESRQQQREQLRQQREQEEQQLFEPVQPPTVHLRPHAMSPPAPNHYDDPASLLQKHKHTKQPQIPAHEPTIPPGGTRSRPRVPLSAVITMSTFMAFMSCLGVLPYFFFSRLSKPWAGLANAVASGVMLAASFGLLAEGAPYSATYLVGGMVLGVMFVKLSQEHLEQYEVDSFEQLAGADARKVILFLAVMAVHAVGEGGGVGVSFAGDRGWAQGTLVTLAIGLHNVPEGLAVATVMAAKGTPPSRILLWTCLTALPQALVAPPAYVFVDTFKALLPLAMGFAAGCMIWIVIAELLPDAFEAVEAEQVATYATGSAAWLQGMSVFIGHLETPAGTLASPFANYKEVLPHGIMPVLLHLLPALLLPGLLAGLLARGNWPRPLLLGLSVGLLASHATASWLQLLLGSSQRLLCAVLLPLIGAGSAALLWGHLKKGWRAVSSAGGSKRAHEGCEIVADCTALGPARGAGLCSSSADASPLQYHPQQWQLGEAAAEPEQQQGWPQPGVITAPAASNLGYSVPHHRGSSHSASEAWEARTGGIVAAAAAAAAAQHGNAWHQQQQQQHPAGLSPYCSPAAAGCSDSSLPTTTAAAGSDGVGGASSGAAWDMRSTSSSGSCSAGPGGYQQHHVAEPHYGGFKGHPGGTYLPGMGSGYISSRGSPLPLPGQGDFVLPVTRRLSDTAARFDWLSGLWDGGSGSARQGLGGWGDSSSRAVVGTSLLALGGVVGGGVPLGLQLAGAVAAAPDHIGHLLPPMLLLGAMFGGACVSLLLPLLGHRSRLVGAAAALVSSMPLLVAVLALLFKPAWVQQGAAFAAADNMQGLLAGFNLFVLLLLVLPMGNRWGPRKCSLGVACGLGWGVAVSGVLALLCALSPYCLHVRAVELFGSSIAEQQQL